MRITLRVTDGPHAGEEFTFAGHDMFLVGRSRRAHFRLPAKDRFFSRIHFMVEVNPPCCRVLDMESRNGTFVNRQRTQAADLRDGDTIHAGKTVFQVTVELDPSESIPDTVMPPVREAPAARDASGTLSYVPLVLPPVAPAQAEPVPVAETCRICGSPPVLPSIQDSTPGNLPLCLDCRVRIRNQPQPIAGYHVVRELGHGGMGVVYLALCAADGAVVALKTILPKSAGSKSDVERFLREAEILRQLEHPHIVRFRHLGECAGRLFIVMEYVAGTDAAGLLQENGPLAVPRAVRLICQLLDGLQYAHARGFVHRDIKPANLLIARRPGDEQVKLTDFGLARVYQTSRLSGLTMTGDMGGTLAYIAPEQITHFREAKPPVDQYAAAATLYNLLTGQILYEGTTRPDKLLLKILQDPPIPIRNRRSDLPVDLADLIHRALAHEPTDRFPDVAAMRTALLPFTGSG
jgi:serine/threonine-protein kinase